MGFIPEEQHCVTAELLQRFAFLAVPDTSQSLELVLLFWSPLCCHISFAESFFFTSLSSVLAHSSTSPCLALVISVLSLCYSRIPSGAKCVREEEMLLSCPQGLALMNSVPLGFARPAKSRAVPKSPLCILFRMVSTALGRRPVPVLQSKHENQMVYPQALAVGRWVCFPRTPVQGGMEGNAVAALDHPLAVIPSWSCAVPASPSICLLPWPVLVSWLCSGGLESCTQLQGRWI